MGAHPTRRSERATPGSPVGDASRLCAAIADRLTFGRNIIETGTASFRLVSSRAARAQEAATG
jgi:hypothetical protein